MAGRFHVLIVWLVMIVALWDLTSNLFPLTEASLSHPTLLRTQLDCIRVTTLMPKASASRHLMRLITTPTRTNYITDIIYYRSSICLKGCDNEHLDDQHFCSILCDRGYKVHVVYSDEDLILGHLTPNFQRKHPLSEVMQWILKGSTTARNVAVIGQEITTMKLLNFLSEVALPMTSRRLDIGAVVLIDPIPFQAMYTEAGRLNVLKRYWESLRSSPDYGRHAGVGTGHGLDYRRQISQWNHFLTRIKVLGRLGRWLGSFAEVRPAIDYSVKFDLLGDQPIDPSVSEDWWAYAEGVKEDADLLTAVLGRVPTQADAVAKALSDRILVLNSIEQSDETQLATSLSSSSLDANTLYWDRPSGPPMGVEDYELGEEEWGLRAADDLALLYCAGPVIDITDTEDSEEDENDNELGPQDQSDESLTVLVMNEVSYSEVDDANASHAFGSEDGGVVGGMYGKAFGSRVSGPSSGAAVGGGVTDLLWGPRDVQKHRRIATAVSDWLDMLVVMKFI